MGRSSTPEPRKGQQTVVVAEVGSVGVLVRAHIAKAARVRGRPHAVHGRLMPQREARDTKHYDPEDVPGGHGPVDEHRVVRRLVESEVPFHHVGVKDDDAIRITTLERIRERSVQRRRMGDAINVRPLSPAENAARHKALGTVPDNRVQEAHLGVVAQVADVHRRGVAYVVVHEATQAARVALGGLDHEVVGQDFLLVDGADVEPPNLGKLHRTHHLFVGGMTRCEAMVVELRVSPEDVPDIREVTPALVIDLQVLRMADALVDGTTRSLMKLLSI